MPELPDIEVYRACLAERVEGVPLRDVRITGPSLLRTVSPAPADAIGRTVVGLRRLGKRIVLAFEGDLFFVFHLMIAGRFQWKPKPPRSAGRRVHAWLDFPTGTLVLTEAGTRKRATLHVVEGDAALAGLDPGGLEVLGASLDAFREALTRENHTLKRALTDPHLMSGIGNAYSDEILHRARLSPVALSQRLDEADIEALHRATRGVLIEWTERLRARAGERFPDKVTAFHPEMAVHGRYRAPCPTCQAPVQRIVRGDHETNYCAPCQTGGKVLADRALSKLLRGDWPRSIEEMEKRRTPAGSRGTREPS